MVRVSPGGPNAFMAHDYHYAKAAYWLNRCAEEAKAHQVDIVLEIHNQLQCRLGEGEVDHKPLFEALLEMGYAGWVTLECHAPFPAYERLEHDFQFVKKLIGP